MQLTQQLLEMPEWSHGSIVRHQLRILDTFRIAGPPIEALTVHAENSIPSETNEYLANNSKIPRHERLRR